MKHKRYRVVSYKWAASRTVIASYDNKVEADEHVNRLESTATKGMRYTVQDVQSLNYPAFAAQGGE